MTYDEIWFNILKNIYVVKGGNFSKYSIKINPLYLESNYNLEKLDCDYYLQKATEALYEGDRRTAAFYLRLEFERLLKVYFKECGKKVVYKEPPFYYATQDFWERAKSKVGDQLKNDIESFSTFLLNPMTHYSNPPVYEFEIAETLGKIRELRDRLCDLTFEVETREMLKS